MRVYVVGHVILFLKSQLTKHTENTAYFLKSIENNPPMVVSGTSGSRVGFSSL